MKCIINGKIILEDSVLENYVLIFDEKIEEIADIKEIDTSCYEVIDAKGQYVSHGLEIFRAVACASLNPAKALGEDKEIGSISVGKRADIIIVDEKFNVNMTILGGEIRYNS